MIKKLLSLLENLCAVCLCILAFSVFFQIVARLLLHIPATWTVEIGRAMFLSIVFLGMPILIYNDGQMVVTMIKDLCSRNRAGALVFHILGDACAYFFLVTLIYGCYDRMLSEWTAAIPTVEWLTYGYLYLIMLIGALCMLYAKAAHTRNYITGSKAKEENGCTKP